MTTTNQKVGRLISQLRQDRGLTQAEFASQLGTSQSAINRIEKGGQNLSLETLARISEVFNQPLISFNPGTINLRIEGGHQLSGSIALKTSKNAAVALLAASLLNQGTTRLKNIARIEEVNRLIEVLISIGVSVRWLPGDELEIKPPTKLDLANIDIASATKTRSVIMFIGSLIHRYPDFSLPYAGGCELGRRTVRPHLYALEEFGVSVDTQANQYHVTTKLHLPNRSVVLYESGDTTTENIIFAAAGTPGKTVIKMASANYMVQEVCLFLQKLGIQIEGIGTSTLTIHGQANIKKNVSYEPSEDPVEAMTFIAAAVVTDSALTIQRAPLEFIELELLKLEKMGLTYDLANPTKAANGYTDLIDVTIHQHHGQLSAPEEKIHPNVFPGLNIDHLPYFVVIAAIANGRTLIHDWVYEDRPLMYIDLKKLNVDLELADPHRVYVTGPNKFKATDLVCPSGIRPAVMLLLAMLAAPGVSTLRNVYTINRGYQDFAERLNSIGANITIFQDL